jgi:hypothetical protein
MLRYATGIIVAVVTFAFAPGCTVELGDEIEFDEEAAFNVAGGGYEIAETIFPAVGVIKGSGLCTGTAISSRVVLTAAHCYDGWNSGNNYIYYSDRQKAYFDQRGGAGKLGVSSITIHPNYDQDDKYNRYDIALVRVKGTMEDTIPVHPDTAPDNRWFIDVGYGQTGQDEKDFGTKRWFANQIDEIDPHHYQYNNKTDRGERPTSCYGDSGGPMMIYSRGWKIVAVNSRLKRGAPWEGCHDADHYAARIDLAYNWIAARD